ncbi:MAG: glycosyltransferase, partial [Myxococcales bacterium]|nr:glycosyltransferase [Myxococcales bacterium]
MNLLHLVSASVPHMGVEHESALGIAGALRDRGHRVVLGCIAPATDPRLAAFHARALAAGFKEFVPLRFRHRVHPIDDLADLRAIRRAVRAYGIDVVHAHRGKDHTLAVLALAGARVPLVRTKHQLHPFAEHPLTRWKNGRRTDALVVPTEGLRRALIE